MIDSSATRLHPDPLSQLGLQGFVDAFRGGRICSEDVTRAYLERIEALDEKLGAFQHVAGESAIATARAMDALRDAGAYLGPLMGVPVAIKDVFVIERMPAPRVGSRVPLSTLAGEAEGPFIRALRQAGCVFLGQTKAVELCLGITGVSTPLGTPWNPHDLHQHRVPGGSSSGSGVAVAAGLCAFAIGTDSGGSVRAPAAYNGVFGLKPGFGLWPVDGSFPLDPRVDSIGLLTSSAADAMIAFAAISSGLFGLVNTPRFPSVELDRLRMGIPADYFLDGLSPDMEAAFSSSCALLRNKGVRLEDVRMPEAEEREGYFPVSMPASLVAALGQDRLRMHGDIMDPVVRARVETGLQSKAYLYLAAENRRQRSIAAVKARFDGFDAWLAPTTASAAPELSRFDDPDEALGLALGMTRNTQPANYLELCAVSLPMPGPPGAMPLGLQLMAPAGHERRLLAIAQAVERILGRQAAPKFGAGSDPAS